MPATRDDLFAKLADLGIETATHEHDAVFTVVEAKGLRGEISGGHTKNLFLKDKRGRLWLVVCLEDRVVDLKALRRCLGAAKSLSFGKPDLLRQVLGIEPGSVTPFAAMNDAAGRVTVVLDSGMLACEPLNFHPLENTATTQIGAQDLIRFLRATGHEPQILDLESPAVGA